MYTVDLNEVLYTLFKCTAENDPQSTKRTQQGSVPKPLTSTTEQVSEVVVVWQVTYTLPIENSWIYELIELVININFLQTKLKMENER